MTISTSLGVGAAVSSIVSKDHWLVAQPEMLIRYKMEGFDYELLRTLGVRANFYIEDLSWPANYGRFGGLGSVAVSWGHNYDFGHPVANALLSGEPLQGSWGLLEFGLETTLVAMPYATVTQRYVGSNTFVPLEEGEITGGAIGGNLTGSLRFPLSDAVTLRYDLNTGVGLFIDPDKGIVAMSHEMDVVLSLNWDI